MATEGEGAGEVATLEAPTTAPEKPKRSRKPKVEPLPVTTGENTPDPEGETVVVVAGPLQEGDKHNVALVPIYTEEARTLTQQERDERERIESAMEDARNNIKTEAEKFSFLMDKIVTKKLYADYEGGAEAYAKSRWDISLSQIRRMNIFGKTVEALTSYRIATGDDSFPMPSHETITRQLNRLGAVGQPAYMAQVMNNAKQIAKDRGARAVTEADVKAAVDKELGIDPKAAQEAAQAPYNGTSSGGLTAGDTNGAHAVQINGNHAVVEPVPEPGNLFELPPPVDDIITDFSQFRHYSELYYGPDGHRHHFLTENVTVGDNLQQYRLQIDGVSDIVTSDPWVLLKRVNDFCKMVRDNTTQEINDADQKYGQSLIDDRSGQPAMGPEDTGRALEDGSGAGEEGWNDPDEQDTEIPEITDEDDDPFADATNAESEEDDEPFGTETDTSLT